MTCWVDRNEITTMSILKEPVIFSRSENEIQCDSQACNEIFLQFPIPI